MAYLQAGSFANESPQEDSVQPHLLLFPFPLVGHINPMLSIGRSLSSSFRVTVLMTRYRLSQLKKKKKEMAVEEAEEEEGDGKQEVMNFKVMPVSVDGMCEEDHEGEWSTPTLLQALGKIGESGTFERWVQELHPPVTCLISDTLVSWTQDVADKLGIPRAAFWASCATSYLLFSHANQLPLDQGDGAGEDDSTIFVKVQGICSNLPAAVLPPKPVLLGILPYTENDRRCTWLIINTSKHVEMEQIQSLEATLPNAKVLAVLTHAFTFPDEKSVSAGSKLTACNDDECSCLHMKSSADSLSVLKNKEDARCLQWLDSKPARSVIYIAFGSLVSLDQQEVHELAIGLENSKKHFLWVLRSSSSTSAEYTSSYLLPPGFVERTHEQGLIVSWAPQRRVLAHPAVSCFLSHCGWNSTVESLASGVPLLCLPRDFADLRVVGWYIEHVWHAGLHLSLKTWSSVEVEKALRALMGEGNGTVTSYHRNATLISQVLQQTTLQKELQLFAEDVMKMAVS